MNITQSIRSFYYEREQRRTTKALAAKQSERKRFLEYAEKALSRTRQDISNWNQALQMAGADDPKNYPIQLLFNEVELDALLTSQEEGRMQKVLSRTFKVLTDSGEVDEEQTKILQRYYRAYTLVKMQALFRGYSLIENQLVASELEGVIVVITDTPRTNVVPRKGRFYRDYSEDTFIDYRNLAEFGTYILEYNTGTLGLLNKAVPHVLFKRFAQSCWSELCEIYGIPPRVLKTNTQDPTMLKRAEKMMADMGAAAWFIIDDTESMDWADGTTTNGDVYKNLINLCSNEISLLFSGAVIGQDTVHGNRSKEEASQKLRDDLTAGDLAMCEEWWNSVTIPALIKLGILKGNVRFKYDAAEDINQLWKMTHESLEYFTVDPEWAKQKFGIEITGARLQPTAGDPAKLAASSFFV